MGKLSGRHSQSGRWPAWGLGSPGHGWQPGGWPWEWTRLLLAGYLPTELIFHPEGNNILKSSCGLSCVSLGKWMGPWGHRPSAKTGPCVSSPWGLSKAWNYGAEFSLKSNHVLCVWGKCCLERGSCDSCTNTWACWAASCREGVKGAEIGFICPLLPSFNNQLPVGCPSCRSSDSGC